MESKPISQPELLGIDEATTEERPLSLAELSADLLKRAEAEGASPNILEGIKELAERAIRAEKLATVDELTGLDNRRNFNAEIERLFKENKLENKRDLAKKGLTVVMFDIDKFKSINDTYGHDIGDQALKAAAEYLNTSVGVRRGDKLARYGGEEFIMLLSNCALDDAIEHKFSRFYDEASGEIHFGFPFKFQHNGQEIELPITFSAGIQELDGHQTYDELVKQADLALYVAKQTGRGKLVAHSRIDEEEKEYNNA